MSEPIFIVTLEDIRRLDSEGFERVWGALGVVARGRGLAIRQRQEREKQWPSVSRFLRAMRWIRPPPTGKAS